MVELHHAVSDNKRVMVRQRHNARAQTNTPGTLGRRGDKERRIADVLKATRVVLADPSLVIRQFVEMSYEVLEEAAS